MELPNLDRPEDSKVAGHLLEQGKVKCKSDDIRDMSWRKVSSSKSQRFDAADD